MLRSCHPCRVKSGVASPHLACGSQRCRARPSRISCDVRRHQVYVCTHLSSYECVACLCPPLRIDESDAFRNSGEEGNSQCFAQRAVGVRLKLSHKNCSIGVVSSRSDDNRCQMALALSGNGATLSARSTNSARTRAAPAPQPARPRPQPVPAPAPQPPRPLSPLPRQRPRQPPRPPHSTARPRPPPRHNHPQPEFHETLLWRGKE